MWLDVLNKKIILLTGGYDNKELNMVVVLACYYLFH